MKKVKIRFITEQETEELKTGVEGDLRRFEILSSMTKEQQIASGLIPAKPKNFINMLEESRNQTKVVLKQVKNSHKWTDPEQMITFMDAFRLIAKAKKDFIMEDNHVEVIIKVMTEVAKAGSIEGFGLEKFTNVYIDFKDAEKV